MAALTDVFLITTRGAQAGAETVPIGAINWITDEDIFERSDGAAWATYTPGSLDLSTISADKLAAICAAMIAADPGA